MCLLIQKCICQRRHAPRQLPVPQVAAASPNHWRTGPRGGSISVGWLVRRIAARRHWMVRCDVGPRWQWCQFSNFCLESLKIRLISGKSHLCFTVKGRCLFLHSVNYVATFLAFIAGAMTGRQSEELPTQTAWTKSPACSSSIKDTLTHWTIVIFLPKLCAERVATSQTPRHRFLQFFLTNQTKCPKEYNDTTKSAPNWSALDILVKRPKWDWSRCMKPMVSRWVFFGKKFSKPPSISRWNTETPQILGSFLSIRVSDALPTQAVPRYGPIPVKRQKCRGFWFWEAETTFECLKKQRRVGDTKWNYRLFHTKILKVFGPRLYQNRQKNCWGDFLLLP